MYNFKSGQELLWAGAVAVATFLLTMLAEFDPDIIEDWRAYGLAAGAGAVRAFAGAILARIAT